MRKRRWQRLGAVGIVGLAFAALVFAPKVGVARAPRKDGVFSSNSACMAMVQRGERLPRAAGEARLASWNLHWFPDGEPGTREGGTDLRWLACTLTWLDADAIAVQEVKQSPRAKQALMDLLKELGRISGETYASALDDCGAQVPQHVGWLWRTSRVRMEESRTLGAVNPSGDACGRQLRPGLAARFRWKGGLDLTAVSVHLKSMANERALDLRESSFAAFPAILREEQHITRDGDVLFLGDMNTVGCEDCEPPLSALDELRAADFDLRRVGLRFVAADAAGSHFHEGKPTLLDHVVAASSMQELDPERRTHVAGACATPSLSSGRAGKELRRRLSDHCPIVLDVADRDLD